MQGIKYWTVMALICLWGPVFSQNYVDALRYSDFIQIGTARSVGAGGSMSALGTDFGTLSTNPAGIALNRKSEFIITPTLITHNIETFLSNNPELNAPISETQSKFALNNFGIVVHSKPRSRDWSTFNFGIGLNKIADFNRTFSFNGQSSGSITDRYLERANLGNALDEFELGLAGSVFALYQFDDPSDDAYYTDYSFAPGEILAKQQFVEEEGGINELSLAFAGNYKEKLMVGLSFGIPFVSYRSEKLYQENDEGEGNEGNVPVFETFSIDERLTTTGTGFNVKLGAIYRVSQLFRVGFSIHTPTFYNLEDNYRTSMAYTYTLQGATNTDEADSPDGLFEYRLRSPWRFNGSAGFVIGKMGFVSGEVEYLDFRNAALGFENFPDDENIANDEISSELDRAIRVRIGGEIAQKIFRIRAGLAMQQSPFIDDGAFDLVYSGGLGLRLRGFYTDLAYRREGYKETYLPYTVVDANNYEPQFVETDVVRSMVILTLGVRF